jgi:DHA2 family multidrug resistance protein
LAEHLNSSNAALGDILARVGGSFGALQNGPAEARLGPMKLLWGTTLRDAYVQSFSDVYLVIMLCFIAAAVLVPLMRKITPPKAPVDAH